MKTLDQLRSRIVELQDTLEDLVRVYAQLPELPVDPVDLQPNGYCADLTLQFDLNEQPSEHRHGLARQLLDLLPPEPLTLVRGGGRSERQAELRPAAVELDLAPGWERLDTGLPVALVAQRMPDNSRHFHRQYLRWYVEIDRGPVLPSRTMAVEVFGAGAQALNVAGCRPMIWDTRTRRTTVWMPAEPAVAAA